MQYDINKLCMILCNKLCIILYNAMVICIVYNLRAAGRQLPRFLPTSQHQYVLEVQKTPTPLKQKALGPINDAMC